MSYYLNFKIKQMKRTLLYTGLVAFALQTGCTKDFEQINTDPTKTPPANYNTDYFLSGSQAKYIDAITGYNGAILFQSGWVQIFASTSSGSADYYSNMDKYVQSGSTADYAGRAWDVGFHAARLANEIVRNYSANADKVNVVSAAIIMKVLCMQYITDIYGDCPYSQAFQLPEGVTLPAYDKQQAVYTAMLSDLDAALSKFDASKAAPSVDLFPYAGNVAQWKKFGYSLMLRLAMRLTKADAATAQKYAEKAAAGGTLASTADDAFIKGDNANGYRSENARALATSADLYQVRWSKSLIEFLRSTGDPRVSAIAEIPKPGLKSNQTTDSIGNNVDSIQLGLPNGWDMNGGATDISQSPGYPGGTGTGADVTSIGKYSRPRPQVYTNLNSAQFVLTYAESELLLAEAKVRGWNVGSATAAAHYANGVIGGFRSLATFPTLSDSAAVSLATATTYAAAHPLNVSSTDASLKMINEQYWATTGMLMNFVEAWNNWKRSGYPVLTPVVYAGNFSNNVIPRRQIYHSGEKTANGANYAIGVSSLTGGDVFNAKVWWDK